MGRIIRAGKDETSRKAISRELEQGEVLLKEAGELFNPHSLLSLGSSD